MRKFLIWGQAFCLVASYLYFLLDATEKAILLILFAIFIQKMEMNDER